MISGELTSSIFQQQPSASAMLLFRFQNRGDNRPAPSSHQLLPLSRRGTKLLLVLPEAQ